MKKTILLIAIITATIFIVINSCSPVAAIKAKSGAQLWGENCQRCHNTPPPNVFNDKQWNVVGTHMQLRANLTQDEVKKIIEFLKTAN